jgi:chromosomal replication initiation ATPase DnaA
MQKQISPYAIPGKQKTSIIGDKDAIINQFCELERCNFNNLISKGRGPRISKADKNILLTNLLLKYYLNHYSEIGKIMNRTHATIIHRREQIEIPELSKRFEKLEKIMF